MTTSGGPVLVTGATGGVGSVAVMLLAKLGYEVHAVTGKASRHDFLRSLGASAILSREEAARRREQGVAASRPGAAPIDTVGGPILFNVIKALRYNASVAACGLVASAEIPATVFPFILRERQPAGSRLGRSADAAQACELWNRLAGPWMLDLEALVVPLTLETLSGAIDRILEGRDGGPGPGGSERMMRRASSASSACVRIVAAARAQAPSRSWRSRG